MTDQEKGQEVSKVQFTETSGSITTLNPSWSTYLSNLDNLDNLQYLRSINGHLWWIALMAQLGLISMVISLIMFIL